MSVRRAFLAASILAISLVVSAASAAGPRDRTAPTTPTNLRITSSGPSSISLEWDASNDNSGKFWYIVQGCGGTIRVDPPTTTFTHTKLWPDRTYSCSVYAVDAAGNRSGTSNVVTHTTPPDTTPPTAPTITANGVWPTRISVSWTQSVDNVSQVWYTLLVDGSPYGADLIGYRGVTVLSLSPATTHTFKVTVRDHFGNRNESTTLSVATPAVIDTVAPSAPKNLRLSSESSPPEAWLDWDESTDDSDPQSQILYEVYVNGELAGESTTIGYGSTLAYCRTDGVDRIVARAIDTSGNASAFSNEILFDC
jgi:chitodextrinase